MIRADIIEIIPVGQEENHKKPKIFQFVIKNISNRYKIANLRLFPFIASRDFFKFLLFYQFVF